MHDPERRLDGMEGWSPVGGPHVPGRDDGTATPCAAPSGAFSLQFGATGLPAASGAWVGWSFTAPPGTRVRSFSVMRTYNLGWPDVSGVGSRPYVLHAWSDDDVAEHLLAFVSPREAGDVRTQSDPRELRNDSADWQSLTLALRCYANVGLLDCPTFPAQASFTHAAVGLADPDGPDVAATDGALVAAAAGAVALRGAADLSFTVSDGGAGVYRAILAVDGTERSRTVVDANGGRCADVEPGNDDAYEFAVPQPCPAVASGTVGLDTKTLPDGEHVVRVAVEDAAGNATVLHDAVVTTHNGPVATAAPTVTGTASVGATLTAGDGAWDGAPTHYAYRWLRCDADGARCAGIAGAGERTYAPTAADVDRRLVAEVVASNASGTGTGRSAPTDPVAAEHPIGGNGTGNGGNGDADGQAPGAGPPHAPVDTQGIQGLGNPLASQPGRVANGANASDDARLRIAFRLSGGREATRVSSPRDRRWTVTGRLTDGAGRPIADARLNVVRKVSGRRWTAKGTIRTDRDGRVTVAVPPGPTRATKLTYFPFSDSRSFRASNVIVQDARAPLAIRAAPRVLRGTRTVALSGKVGGELLPRGGLLVTLQGYQPGFGWRTFRTVRTRRDGRWSTHYRFRLSHGRFAFRAVVPRQGTFPFATSCSAAITVAVE